MLAGGERSDHNLAPIIKKLHHDSDHDAKHISTPVDNDTDKKDNGDTPSALINPEDLVGRTFLLVPHPTGGWSTVPCTDRLAYQ